MKITKIIAAFMVAGLIGIAGCGDAATEVEGGPDPAVEGLDAEGTMDGLPAEDPGDGPDPAPVDEPDAAPEADE